MTTSRDSVARLRSSARWRQSPESLHSPVVAVLCVVVLLTGCTHAGPRLMEPDRFHYANALGDTRESQALLNIVKLRYNDFPTFLDLNQIVTNYQVVNQLVVSGLGRVNKVEGADVDPDEASGVYTTSVNENPSFVYLPVDGPDLLRKMLTPSSIPVVLGLVQTGWPVDTLLTTLAFSANGKLNRELQGVTVHQPDPEFLEFVRAARQAQIENALVVRFEDPTPEVAAERTEAIARATAMPTSTAKHAALAALGPPPVTVELCFRPQRLSPGGLEELAVMREGLDLDPGAGCYEVIAGDTSPDRRTIALQMRSLFQLMAELAVYVDVPEADLASGAAPQLAWTEAVRAIEKPPLLQVHSGSLPPDDPLVAVAYAGSWFWIERNDLQSKRTFIFLLLLLSITESGGSGAQLVVTTN